MNNQDILVAILGFLDDSTLPEITKNFLKGIIIKCSKKPEAESEIANSPESYRLVLITTRYLLNKLIDKVVSVLDPNECQIIFCGMTTEKIKEIIKNTEIPSEEELAKLKLLTNTIQF